MKTKILYILSILGAIFLLVSCENVPVGYLDVENASYASDTVVAYKKIDPASDRAINNAPFTSLAIQGVAGTNPINYEFHSVKVANGGDQEKFMQVKQDGGLIIQGSLILLFPSGVKKLPNGIYSISLKVYNEGYSEILEDVFTFIIKDDKV